MKDVMPKPLSKAERKRKSEILGILSEMSRDNWRNARFDDYHALEVELSKLSMRHRLALAKKA